MLRKFDQHVIDAACVLVDTYGDPGREYLAEAMAVATGRATPGRLDDLALQLPKHRRERGASRPSACAAGHHAP